MKTFTHNLRRGGIPASFVLSLCNLAPAWAEEPAQSFVDMVESVALGPPGMHDSERPA